MKKLDHVALFISFVSVMTMAVCFPAIALSNRSVPAGGKGVRTLAEISPVATAGVHGYAQDYTSNRLAQSDYFGAIAYSKSTGRWGSAWNAGTQEEADQYAVINCRTTTTGTTRPKRQRGEDCEVLLSFQNACGALAKARNGGIAWNEGRTLEEAKNLTSNRCTRDFGSCKFIVSVCSRGNKP